MRVDIGFVCTRRHFFSPLPHYEHLKQFAKENSEDIKAGVAKPPTAIYSEAIARMSAAPRAKRNKTDRKGQTIRFAPRVRTRSVQRYARSQVLVSRDEDLVPRDGRRSGRAFGLAHGVGCEGRGGLRDECCF